MKEYKNPSFVSGLSVQNIMKMDLSTIPQEHLSKTASRVISAVNKRSKRLAEKEGKEYTPLSIKGKTPKQIITTVKKAIKIYNAPTKSLSGKQKKEQAKKAKQKQKQKEKAKRAQQKARAKRAPQKARAKKKRPNNLQRIKGYTYEQYNKLSEKELRKEAQTLAGIARKRVKRLEKEGGSYASTWLDKQLGGDGISTRGKTRNELLHLFSTLKQFLDMETATVSGKKKVEKNVIASLKKENIDIDEQNYDKVFKALGELDKNFEELSNKDVRYKVIDSIQTMVKKNKNISVDDLVENMKERITEAYKDVQQERKRIEDTWSDYFEM